MKGRKRENTEEEAGGRIERMVAKRNRKTTETGGGQKFSLNSQLDNEAIPSSVCSPPFQDFLTLFNVLLFSVVVAGEVILEALLIGTATTHGTRCAMSAMQ
jgi:hypothetical protein